LFLGGVGIVQIRKPFFKDVENKKLEKVLRMGLPSAEGGTCSSSSPSTPVLLLQICYLLYNLVVIQ
jgi:hypothetical protein